VFGRGGETCLAIACPGIECPGRVSRSYVTRNRFVSGCLNTQNADPSGSAFKLTPNVRVAENPQIGGVFVCLRFGA